MSRFFKHLKHITKHRHMVFRLCCKCGLFWRGLMHDLSKYSKVEFWEGVKYYTDGCHSPISKCRRENGYSMAWIHHKNRNKHHIEYWYDRENQTQMSMPYKYAVESICDKIAATKCYNGKKYTPQKVLDYWLQKDSYTPMNNKMKTFYTKVFADLVEFGEKYVLNKKYMKKVYKDIIEN